MNEASQNMISAVGVSVDLSRMKLPSDLAERHRDLVDRALAQMNDIEAGKKVNKHEDRQVGHYWLRNPNLAPDGYGDCIRSSWEAIEEFVTPEIRERFDNILWIGIGGSGLGPQMLYDALRVPGRMMRMFFFDNTDPFGFHRTLLEVAEHGGLARTLTVVISKSGGTPETANGMRVAMQEYAAAGLTFAEHAVAITMPKSGLDKLAQDSDSEPPQRKWLARFPIWDWVGGRTSLLSAVGLLPAQLLGLSGSGLRDGAREMDDATRSPEATSNPAMSLALCWYHAVETLGRRNMVVLPYADRMCLLSKYLQQLVMESLGKDGKGITVFGNKGSTDQHSYIQQLRDGYNDFFAVFFRVLDRETDRWEVEPGVTAGDYLAAFQEGTAEALSEAGRLSMCLTVEKFDERTLGALIALFERAVGYYGALIDINAYHQPGVEAGKKAAADILAKKQRDRP